VKSVLIYLIYSSVGHMNMSKNVTLQTELMSCIRQYLHAEHIAPLVGVKADENGRYKIEAPS